MASSYGISSSTDGVAYDLSYITEDDLVSPAFKVATRSVLVKVSLF